MGKPKVVAFMQNMWVRDPERVRSLIERHGEAYRRRLIHYALFAGCLSGRRFKAAFGEDVCRSILWEESSREITGASNGCPPADRAHIKAVLKAEMPDVVLAFGHIASKGVDTLWDGTLIIAPHPAARHDGTMDALKEAARSLACVARLQQAKSGG